MFKKLFFSFVTLFSIHSFALTPYEVSQLPSFGFLSSNIESYIKSLIANGVSVKHALEWHFEERQKEIVQAINQKFGINKVQWQNIENLFHSIMAKDPLFKPHHGVITSKTSGHPILKTARQLLANYGMNPNAITIVNSSTDGIGEVSMILTANNIPKYTLGLNIPVLSKYTPAEYTALIRHEIQHIKYGDVLILNLYRKALPSYISIHDVSTFIKNCELRADIMSAISSTDDIDALIAWCEKTVYYEGESYNETHPTFSQRIDALKKAREYLLIEQNCLGFA